MVKEVVFLYWSLNSNKIISETRDAIIKALQPIYLLPMTWKTCKKAPKNSQAQALCSSMQEIFFNVLTAICDIDYVFKRMDIGDYGTY